MPPHDKTPRSHGNPDNSNNDRVLAVMAHPDDAELLCAGTLARAKADGATIGIVVFATICVIVANLLLDVLNLILDPRLRTA